MRRLNSDHLLRSGSSGDQPLRGHCETEWRYFLFVCVCWILQLMVEPAQLQLSTDSNLKVCMCSPVDVTTKLSTHLCYHTRPSPRHRAFVSASADSGMLEVQAQSHVLFAQGVQIGCHPSSPLHPFAPEGLRP